MHRLFPLFSHLPALNVNVTNYRMRDDRTTVSDELKEMRMGQRSWCIWTPDRVLTVAELFNIIYYHSRHRYSSECGLTWNSVLGLSPSCSVRSPRLYSSLAMMLGWNRMYTCTAFSMNKPWPVPEYRNSFSVNVANNCLIWCNLVRTSATTRENQVATWGSIIFRAAHFTIILFRHF